MDELTTQNGMKLKYHTSLAYSSAYRWDEKNEKRQLDLPYIESTYLRTKPWHLAHAYWIKQHNNISQMTAELINSTTCQTSEESDAVQHLRLYEEIEIQSG